MEAASAEICSKTRHEKFCQDWLRFQISNFKWKLTLGNVGDGWSWLISWDNSELDSIVMLNVAVNFSDYVTQRSRKREVLFIYAALVHRKLCSPHWLITMMNEKPESVSWSPISPNSSHSMTRKGDSVMKRNLIWFVFTHHDHIRQSSSKFPGRKSCRFICIWTVRFLDAWGRRSKFAKLISGANTLTLIASSKSNVTFFKLKIALVFSIEVHRTNLLALSVMMP